MKVANMWISFNT